MRVTLVTETGFEENSLYLKVTDFTRFLNSENVCIYVAKNQKIKFLFWLKIATLEYWNC